MRLRSQLLQSFPAKGPARSLPVRIVPLLVSVLMGALVIGMQSLGYHPTITGESAMQTVTQVAAEAFDIAIAASLDIFADL